MDEVELGFLVKGNSWCCLRSLLALAWDVAVDSGVVCVATSSCGIITFPFVFSSPFASLSASFACGMWEDGKWDIVVMTVGRVALILNFLGG